MSLIDRIFHWDQPTKDFFQYLRTRRNLISLGPSKILWFMADLGLSFKKLLKTKALDRIISIENQKEIRWHYVQIKWRGIEKPFKFLVLKPINELFHYFFAVHTKTIYRYYCQSYVFMV